MHETLKIGIDFGTTNSSTAVYRNGDAQVIKTPAAESSGILPSLLYIDRKHEVIHGTQAAQQYLQHETGRPAL